jgi:hypothetical protein
MKSVVSCLALFVLLVAATAVTAEEKPKAGDVVWAEWKPNAWFHGKIAKVDGKDFTLPLTMATRPSLTPQRSPWTARPRRTW